MQIIVRKGYGWAIPCKFHSNHLVFQEQTAKVPREKTQQTASMIRSLLQTT
jgi:hypothetical protein